jgi:L-threonylcarbamoyladenylate synthase
MKTGALKTSAIETRIVGLSEGMAEALRLLDAGRPVGVPTETVYGLAADATNGDAVAAIYEAKGRPAFNPLICHVDGLAMAQGIATPDDTMLRLAEAFWPGPLTLVMPLALNPPMHLAVHPLALAGLKTVALRQPLGPLAKLAHRLGRPLAAPSANPSGGLSPTTASAVAAGLGGRIPLVLDGGASPVGVESTIIGRVDGRLTLLRPGGLAAEAIERVAGARLFRPAGEAAIAAPGMLASHYAPRAAVRIDAHDLRPGEALLAFGPHPLEGRPVAMLNLSEKGDTVEAARNLFSHLQALDEIAPSAIAVMPVPETGLGEAINDRLRRAAAPRPPSGTTG